uniref:Protein UmuD n=1 Tax=Escherichia coli TaxID=562 RepID=A0A6G6AJX7_ECOLX|nr:Protein UmuD [Escherichia coli]
MSTVYHRPADPSGDDSYVRPLFADRCRAGFPSPATDYAEQELDLNSYCISRPAATFFLRASGESMNRAGVQNGDLLVVDRAEKPQHGDIVIAEIDGEFTVKRLLLRPRPALEPVSDSPEFRTLYPENICIFGVVTHVIHRTREFTLMFALADINSFYASCEKVFRPDLRNEPVIVLSNNDGCVIARSPEAKKPLASEWGSPGFR